MRDISTTVSTLFSMHNNYLSFIQTTINYSYPYIMPFLYSSECCNSADNRSTVFQINDLQRQWKQKKHYPRNLIHCCVQDNHFLSHCISGNQVNCLDNGNHNNPYEKPGRHLNDRNQFYHTHDNQYKISHCIEFRSKLANRSSC